MFHVRSPSLPCVDRSSSLDNLDDKRTWRRKYLQFDRGQRTLTFYPTDVCAEFFFVFFSRASSVMSIIPVLTVTHIIASSSFSVGRRETRRHTSRVFVHGQYIASGTDFFLRPYVHWPKEWRKKRWWHNLTCRDEEEEEENCSFLRLVCSVDETSSAGRFE